MSPSPSVLLTVPKYVTIKQIRSINTNNPHSNTNWCQVQPSETPTLPMENKMYDVIMQEKDKPIETLDDMENLQNLTKKKRRLDHLTWEEKIQRK